MGLSTTYRLRYRKHWSLAWTTSPSCVHAGPEDVCAQEPNYPTAHGTLLGRSPMSHAPKSKPIRLQVFPRLRKRQDLFWTVSHLRLNTAAILLPLLPEVDNLSAPPQQCSGAVHHHLLSELFWHCPSWMSCFRFCPPTIYSPYSTRSILF